jgi:hypothetical protein
MKEEEEKERVDEGMRKGGREWKENEELEKNAEGKCEGEKREEGR